MKVSVFLIILFCTTAICRGQVSFTSTYTQTWPTLFTTEVDEVERSIWIDAYEIIIITGTPNGKDIEKLEIKRYEEGESADTFYCTSQSSKEPVTVVIPAEEKIRVIDLYRISPKTREEIQIRLHVNRQDFFNRHQG